MGVLSRQVPYRGLCLNVVAARSWLAPNRGDQRPFALVGAEFGAYAVAPASLVGIDGGRLITMAALSKWMPDRGSCLVVASAWLRMTAPDHAGRCVGSPSSRWSRCFRWSR